MINDEDRQRMLRVCEEAFARGYMVGSHGGDPSFTPHKPDFFEMLMPVEPKTIADKADELQAADPHRKIENIKKLRRWAEDNGFFMGLKEAKEGMDQAQDRAALATTRTTP